MIVECSLKISTSASSPKYQSVGLDETLIEVTIYIVLHSYIDHINKGVNTRTSLGNS